MNAMWPFSKNKLEKIQPRLTIGSMSAWRGDDGWSFVDTEGEYDFVMYDNSEFHDSIVGKIPIAKQWISNLKPEIESIINDHVGDWRLETDDHAVVVIDVSHLAEKNQIDVAYGCEQWADYGVNIVITDGKITDSYGGD